ncbi:MAG: thiamine pyrophosphate-binding protein, partial [Mesorhizobium sp.]
MKRFDCMKALAARLKDELVILSLGGSVDEWYNAAPHMR